MSFNWTCPHCERAVTIEDARLSADQHVLWIPNADGRRTLSTTFIVCPNDECRKLTLSAFLSESSSGDRGEKLGKTLQTWRLIPSSKAKTFPDYVPKPILDDYSEACLIQDLSPKAAATLARRCLQGIIRDFWKAKPGRLVDEIKQIEDKVDEESWKAIDAVRKIGNIGAHMEKDISVIVDVDPNEADLLIQLVETLLREWYVATQERQKRMRAIVAMAQVKTEKPSNS